AADLTVGIAGQRSAGIQIATAAAVDPGAALASGAAVGMAVGAAPVIDIGTAGAVVVAAARAVRVAAVVGMPAALAAAVEGGVRAVHCHPGAVRSAVDMAATLVRLGTLRGRERQAQGSAGEHHQQGSVHGESSSVGEGNRRTGGQATVATPTGAICCMLSADVSRYGTGNICLQNGNAGHWPRPRGVAIVAAWRTTRPASCWWTTTCGCASCCSAIWRARASRSGPSATAGRCARPWTATTTT